jgi:hypothetical protein
MIRVASLSSQNHYSTSRDILESDRYDITGHQVLPRSSSFQEFQDTKIDSTARDWSEQALQADAGVLEPAREMAPEQFRRRAPSRWRRERDCDSKENLDLNRHYADKNA